MGLILGLAQSCTKNAKNIPIEDHDVVLVDSSNQLAQPMDTIPPEQQDTTQNLSATPQEEATEKKPKPEIIPVDLAPGKHVDTSFHGYRKDH